MSGKIQHWWEERLLAKRPLGFYLIQGYDFRNPQGTSETPTWPHSVARMSLYDDYSRWCEEREYLNIEDQLMFFLVIRPWLYVSGNKDWHVRNYMVRQQQPFEGGYITLKKRRYFIRLCPWQDHVDAFEAATGYVFPKEARPSYSAT